MTATTTYAIEVRSTDGWTTHSEHADYSEARDQADMVHGRLRVDQGVTCVLLETYDVDALEFVGWINEDGEFVDCMDGLHYADYFADGQFVGADTDGVQPLFRDAE